MWKDSETEIDLLNFDSLIEITKEIILDKELSPCSIGIYGNWGSGKSSLMEMIQMDLSEKKGIQCVKFNGWLFEGYEDARTSLLTTIIQTIESNKSLKGTAKTIFNNLYEQIDFFKLASRGIRFGLDYAITGGIGTVASFTLKSLISKANEKGQSLDENDIENTLKSLLESRKLNENIKNFQVDFKKLLELTKIDNLVIFIDELDRCSHDTILDTLEVMRLFLFSTGTSFIIGADERQIMYAIRRKFPESQNQGLDIGKEYLEKLIQYPVKIPQLSAKEVEYYITCLQFQKEFNKEDYDKLLNLLSLEKKKDLFNFRISYESIEASLPKLAVKAKTIIALSKQISSVLAQQLNGNPRHCKRFLNSLSMRLKMASFKEIPIDQRILAKVMILEYFKPELYREIGILQSKEGGKPTEVGLWEKNEIDTLESLKLWKNDNWVKSWFESEPKLTLVDLQPYYYMTRESLRTSSYFEHSGLSNQAQKIVDDLQSGSDAKIKTAISLSEILSPFEKSKVLGILIDKLEVGSKIENKDFKATIDFTLAHEILYSSFISFLKRIPANKISIAFIPRIKDFSNHLDNSGDIEKLFASWKKENTKLQSVLK